VADYFGAQVLQSAHYLIEGKDRGRPIRISSGNIVVLEGDGVLYFEQRREEGCKVDALHVSQPGE
jgi:hypothetical protein